MTVWLAPAARPPAANRHRWVTIDRDPAWRPAGPVLDDIGTRLETAMASIRPRWESMAKDLAARPDTPLSHLPSCAANVNDFGLMLAWGKVIADLAAESEDTLVICDDPWLFRHLAGLPGVKASSAPPLWARRLKLAIRGFAARVSFALRMAHAAISLRRATSSCPVSRPALLVYGHPASRGDGWDAYFGSLMMDDPRWVRLLHVDCPPARVGSLGGDGRTFSLHGAGSPIFALLLPFITWRPPVSGPESWLLRRARVLEGGTAQAAAIRWQIHCQRRWLAGARPSVVVWPWENHGWERALVRSARGQAIATVGSQHSTIGRFEWNYNVAFDFDGLPDLVLAAGDIPLDVLKAAGVPKQRLRLGGTFRFVKPATTRYCPSEPIFVALPAHARIAGEMIGACVNVAAKGRKFMVREHPLAPVGFRETAGMTRSPCGLDELAAVGGVLYAGTTVGLESALAGLPTIRFIASGSVANDILPPGFPVPTATAADLDSAFDTVVVPPAYPIARLFAPPDQALWRRLAAGNLAEIR